MNIFSNTLELVRDISLKDQILNEWNDDTKRAALAILRQWESEGEARLVAEYKLNNKAISELAVGNVISCIKEIRAEYNCSLTSAKKAMELHRENAQAFLRKLKEEYYILEGFEEVERALSLFGPFVVLIRYHQGRDTHLIANANDVSEVIQTAHKMRGWVARNVSFTSEQADIFERLWRI